VVAEAKSCHKNTNAQYCQRETRTERECMSTDTPLKSFELFFDGAVITEIVTWTNKKTENVKTSYRSKRGFLYNTSVTEIRALIRFLLFLDVTKSSKESTASIWAKDGTGKPICIAATSQKLFWFLLYCLRFDDPSFNHVGPVKSR